MIPMHDGVRLAMDIYRPALEDQPVHGKFPALIERTTYDKRRLSLIATAKFFAAHGYVCTMQDVRGRLQSEGDGVFLLDEGPDGFDTTACIAQQPWGDGQVGTIGLFYSTATQQSAAVLNLHGLKAQFHLDGGYNDFHRTIRHSWTFESGVLLPYAFRSARISKEVLADVKVRDALDTFWTNIKPWLGHPPMRADVSPLKPAPSYEAWFLEDWRRGNCEDCWRRPGANVEPFIGQFPDIPIYLQSSWCGRHVWATTTKFIEPRKRVKSPVRVFAMGGGAGRKNTDGHLDHGGVWRDDQDWSLPAAHWVPYPLHADGTLSPEPPEHQDPPDSYTPNANGPVPTIGGGVQHPMGSGLLQGSGFAQRGRRDLGACKDTLPLASRADVLVFEALPLLALLQWSGRSPCASGHPPRPPIPISRRS